MSGTRVKAITLSLLFTLAIAVANVGNRRLKRATSFYDATNHASTFFGTFDGVQNLAFSLTDAVRRDYFPSTTGISPPESQGLPAELHGIPRVGKLIRSINTCLSGRRALVNNQPTGCHLAECHHPSRASGKRRPALWLASTWDCETAVAAAAAVHTHAHVYTASNR